MPKGVAPFLVRLIQFFLLPALPPHVITGQRIFPVGGRQFVLRIGRINSVCKPAFLSIFAGSPCFKPVDPAFLKKSAGAHTNSPLVMTAELR